MPRISVALKLTHIDYPSSNEGVQVFAANNKWSSPAGGWLAIQAGVWNQLPDGLHLMDTNNREHVAILSGLVFVTCDETNRGVAKYFQPTGTGEWNVIATNP